MAGNTKALVVAVSMMLLINLYECVSIYIFFQDTFHWSRFTMLGSKKEESLKWKGNKYLVMF